MVNLVDRESRRTKVTIKRLCCWKSCLAFLTVINGASRGIISEEI